MDLALTPILFKNCPLIVAAGVASRYLSAKDATANAAHKVLDAFCVSGNETVRQAAAAGALAVAADVNVVHVVEGLIQSFRNAPPPPGQPNMADPYDIGSLLDP